MKYETALQIALQLKVGLADGCERIEIVGSVKRHDKEDVHDIEILCIAGKAPRPEFGQKVVFKTALEKAIHVLQDDDVLGKAEKNGDKYKKIKNTRHGRIESVLPRFVHCAA